jgi:hypothetical protein
VVELPELDSELLPASEEDDEVVWFWAVQAGLVIGPVRWAGVAQFGQVGYSLLFLVSLSFSFVSVLLLWFNFELQSCFAGFQI